MVTLGDTLRLSIKWHEPEVRSPLHRSREIETTSISSPPYVTNASHLTGYNPRSRTIRIHYVHLSFRVRIRRELITLVCDQISIWGRKRAGFASSSVCDLLNRTRCHVNRVKSGLAILILGILNPETREQNALTIRHPLRGAMVKVSAGHTPCRAPCCGDHIDVT